jgi:cytoskeletal protein CcmA (bactofilin family)
MAWSWIERKKHEAGEWTGFIEKGVRLEGKLETTGTFRIDSEVKASIVSRDTLILGEHALVEGDIEGNVVLIAGRFSGKIQARGRVEIQARAIVTGEIQTPCLMIEPGAVFDGQCLVPVANQDLPPLTILVRYIPITSEAAAASVTT